MTGGSEQRLSGPPMMSRWREPAAQLIDEAIERAVVGALPGLASAGAHDDWYDAVTTRAVGPRTTDDVVFAGTCVVPRDTQVEIKATQRTVSHGAAETQPGRWSFERARHDRLLAARACYLLALYNDAGAGREPTQLVFTPAAVVDECLAGRWYDAARSEGCVAQLAWPHLLGELGGDAQ